MSRTHFMVSILTLFLLVNIAIVATGNESGGLQKRALAAMSDRSADPTIQGPLLAQYADSLRSLNPVLAAHCLERSGIAAFRASNLDTALARWQRGVDWARNVPAATDSSRQAESSLLNALAIGHTARGDVEAALPIYDQTLQLRHTMKDTLGLSRTWGNLATGYANIGRTAEALSATAEAGHWLKFVDNPRGTVSNALRPVLLLTSMGRLDEALWQSRLALDMADSLGGLEERAMATMYHGNALQDNGRAKEALPMLQQAEKLMIESGDDYSLIFVRQSLIQCLLFLERNAEALAQVRALLPLVEEANLPHLQTVLLRYEGHALFALNHPLEAQQKLEQALVLFETRRDNLEDDRSRTGIFQASGEIYAALARCQLAAGQIEEAFLTVERGRAKIFSDQMGQPEIRLESLQDKLWDTEAALVLFNDPGRDPLVAFILDGRTLQIVELGNVSPIAEDARAALRLLAAGQNLESCRPALHRLDESLCIPILSRINPRVKRFSVVPPSFLTGFPLGMLEGPEGKAWGAETPLNYLPNATALLNLGLRTAPASGVLAFADPNTTSQSEGLLPSSSARAQAGVPLPEARHEIQALTRNPDRQRMGAQASGTELRHALGTPLSVLHLATHAVVDPVDGGRSAIVLAGDKGLDAVTAQEISAFDFKGDLVVLSGCSTFGTHQVLGEGWFGLPRSFLVAGARTVISTLWDVDDLGARRFMTAFYQALSSGLPRDLALVQARNTCRDQGMPPREWAAFVLTGVGDEGLPWFAESQLDQQKWNRKWGVLLLALTALVATIIWFRRDTGTSSM